MTPIDPHILNLVRDGDRARYVSALLAPSEIRDRLLTLYAYDLEISAIPDRVVEPLAGEIRLQWWRDVFDRSDQGSISGNPVADGVVKLLRETDVSKSALMDVLDTQSHLFHENPVPDRNALERFFDARYGAIMLTACKLLSPEVTVDDCLIPSAARAAGYTALVTDFGKQASKQRLLVPSRFLDKHNVDLVAVYRGESSGSVVSMLDEFREIARQSLSEVGALIRKTDTCFVPAFAHLTTLSRVLDVSESAKQKPFTPLRDMNPFLLQWRIWRFARTRKL